MGSRKRKVIRIFKRTLPKIFGCPRCGVAAVRVNKKEDGDTIVVCGGCGLTLDNIKKSRKEPIDIYNEYVDLFMAGKL